MRSGAALDGVGGLGEAGDGPASDPQEARPPPAHGILNPAPATQPALCCLIQTEKHDPSTRCAPAACGQTLSGSPAGGKARGLNTERRDQRGHQPSLSYLQAVLPGVVFIVTVQLFYRHVVHKRLKYFRGGGGGGEREREREGERKVSQSYH